MNNTLDFRKAKRIKAEYPKGTRIELISMDDPFSPIPTGMRGTVDFVDDIGTVFPIWDNGRTLGLVAGEDVYRKLTNQELEDESLLQTSKNEEDTGMQRL